MKHYHHNYQKNYANGQGPAYTRSIMAANQLSPKMTSVKFGENLKSDKLLQK